MPRKGRGQSGKRAEAWDAASANDLAARMTARAVADIIAQANARAKSYEALDTPAARAAADALRKFADSLAR